MRQYIKWVEQDKRIATVLPKDLRWDQRLKEEFKKHDKNGDGVLDKDELREAFKNLGAILPGWRASRALSHADADGDGLISQQELTDLISYAMRCGYTVRQKMR